MNKYFKYGLYSVGGLVAIFAGALIYIALTFNPNSYKLQVIKAVKDSMQRTLKLEGDIQLTFFPSIGARIGQVSLSEFMSDAEFVSVGEARVSLAFLPLLSKHVVVDEVLLKGLKAKVIKHKDGSSNLDDLLSEKGDEVAEPHKEATAPVKFDIASVRVDDTELSYVDEKTGAQYNVGSLSLHTGRIANGEPSKIDFSAHIVANQPHVDVTTQLKTTITIDLDKNIYQVQGLDMQAKGAALDIVDLAVKFGLDAASADIAKQSYMAKNFAFTASGVKGKDKFGIKLDVPALSMAESDISAGGLALNAQLDAALGKVVADVVLPSVKGDLEKIKLSDLTINVDFKQSEQAFKLRLSTPVVANLKTKQFNLSDLVIALNATGNTLPGKSVSSELKGSLQADMGRQSIQANLAGGMLQSQVKAKFGVTNFDRPAVRYDLEIDQFDAGLYIPKSNVTQGEAAAVPEQPFDLSALKPLNVEGSVRVGALKAANVSVKQLRVDLKAKNGLVKVAPFSANLYNGNIASSIDVDANKTQPAFVVNATLKGIEIGPLLQDTLNMDFVSGKGSVAINVNTQGNKVSMLKKGLNGTLGVNLIDGAVKGINLAKSAREFGKGSNKTENASKSEQTDFSELKATFKITHGVAHNEDFSMKSPFIRVGGKGDINIGNDSLDYLVKATIAGTAEGQGGKDNVGGLTIPVRLSGPFNDLKFKLDFGAVISDQAKQQAAAAVDTAKAKAAAEVVAIKQKAQQALDAQKSEAKAKAEAELRKGLGGLFK